MTSGRFQTGQVDVKDVVDVFGGPGMKHERTAEAVVADLSRRGVRLVADRDEIEIHAPPGVLAAADRDQLRLHKPEILAFLTRHASGWSGPEWAWRSEYIAELGRLCLLIRGADSRIADQLRELVRMPAPQSSDQWLALGTAWRTIDKKGMYTSGDHGGAFTVKAVSGSFEAIAEVRISTSTDPTPPPPPTPGARRVRWRGTVPPQKWMNFYTKVLTRLTSSPDLRLEVSFEATVDNDQAQNKLDDTRTGLKELGLDEGASLA